MEKDREEISFLPNESGNDKKIESDNQDESKQKLNIGEKVAFIPKDKESGNYKKIESDNQDESKQNKATANDTHDDSKQDTRRKFLKCLVWFLSGLTIFLLIGLLSVTVVWHVQRVKDLAPKEHDICLQCSELKSRYDDDNVLDLFTRNPKKGECCGTTSQILKRLVDKSTKEKYVNDLSNNYFASNSEECDDADQIPEKPSAKVAGISFTDMKQDASELNVIHWNNTGAQSFFKKHLQYMKGNIRIDQPGFYYIFSQLKWFINDTDTLPIVHQVYLKSNTTGVHDVILETRKSNCELIDESAETTSSVGAIFELRQGDKIFVTTSRPENLLPCHHGNFFGLYLVAEAISHNK